MRLRKILYILSPLIVVSAIVYGQSHSSGSGSSGSSGDFKADGSVAMTGALNLGTHLINGVVDPVSAQDGATKNYVDTVASALQPIQAVTAASTGDYPGSLVAGVLTVTATGAISVDGQSPAANTRILLKDQATGAQNGVYTVTNAGSVGVSPVLTRATDYNTAAEVNAGDLVPVINGTVNSGRSYLQTATIVTINTDSLVFTLWSYKSDPISQGISNCSISSSVSANALTVSILTAAGNTPSASDPCVIAFRNTSATVGTYSQVNVTAATTAVITDDGTLGCTAATLCALYVYALNNAGTVVAAVDSFKFQDEGATMSSTTAAASSDTMGTLYSTTGVSSVAGRLLGELQITLGASNHWSANSTKISNIPFKHYMTDWTATTPVLTVGSGSMTNTTLSGQMRRRGQSIEIFGKAAITGSTGTWGRFQVSPPTNCTVDTSASVAVTNVTPLGYAIMFTAGAADYAGTVFWSSPWYVVETWNSAGTYAVITDLSQAIPAAWASGDSIGWYTTFPCTNW